MKVGIKSILKNFSKDIEFLQPVYETIINSLEAGAKNIHVTFKKDNQNIGIENVAKLNGFVIEDDGEGFIQKNIDAFNELWTPNKLKLGCKGSGRFTWLTVFKNITIESYIKNEGQKITIPFSIDYDEEKIILEKTDVEKNKTIITFSDTHPRFIKTNKKGKIIDKREYADLNYLYNKIKDYLLISLFLSYKKQNKTFNIVLELDGETKIINNNSIDELKTFNFNVKCDAVDILDNESYSFDAYYLFLNDNKEDNKIFLCSNNRPSKNIKNSEIGMSQPIPGKYSFILLVTSDYLDDKDDDTRSGLIKLSYLKNATPENPILISQILEQLKLKFKDIVLSAFPEIKNINDKAIAEAKKERPYLSSEIDKDNDIIKTKKSIIQNAKYTFGEAKEKVEDQFLQMLKSKDIKDDDFKREVANITSIAAAELGEYILYRKNIVAALNAAINDKSKKEKFIHNVFMTKGTDKSCNKDIYSNNFWLLDDKFMNFNYATSDITINKIGDKLKSYIFTKDGNKRPDLALFYNRDADSNVKDIIIVELKGLNATTEQKTSAYSEISNNIAALRKKIPTINNIWAYIITDLDSETEESYKNLAVFKPLFTHDSKHKIYYTYNPNVNAHIYLQSIEAITTDATERNSTFLKILNRDL